MSISRLVLIAALALYAALTWAATTRVERTADEIKYINAGRAVANAGWEHELTRLHGPLPFYANQWFVADFPAGGVRHDRPDRDLLARARRGMIGFGLLAALVVFLWTREVFGEPAAAVAVTAFALHPLMIGYGALTAVDMAYTAGVLFALYASWRFWMSPKPARAVLLGVALGLALATKYLALLVVPVVFVTAAWRPFLDGGSWGERLKRTATAKLSIALAAWVTLVASYGFRVPLASTDPALYSTPWLAELLQVPVLGALVACVPAPFLLGIDYQLSAGEMELWPYLNGRFAPGHWDYYLWIFLRKAPEWWLLAVAWIAALRLAPWWRAGGARRAWVICALPAVVVLFVYLSFFSRLQIGVRYVLPLYAISFVALGGLVSEGWFRKLSTRSLGLLALAWLFFQGGDLARAWPNTIAYYNLSSGDAGRAHEWFADSNSDWGQKRLSGREELEAQGYEAVERGAGPRLGRLAIYLRDWVRRDPEDGTRRYHWLDALEPSGHVGAAWWTFDSTREAWERAAATGDERTRESWAVILLAEGESARAEAVIAELPPPRASLLRELLDTEETVAPERAVRLATVWTAVGRYDRAEAVLRRHGSRATRLLLAEALSRQQRWDEALEVFEADPPEDAAGWLLYAELLRRAERFEEALATLEERSPGWTALEQERARLLAQAIEEVRSFQAFLY